MATKRAGRPLLVIIVVLVVVIMYSGFASWSQQSPAAVTAEQKLEQILQQIQHVGQVRVYFHYGEIANEESELFSDYFRTSETATTISGVLIVAEGATSPSIKKLLMKTVSDVMQLPQHRIVIVPMEMKGEPL